MRRVITPIHQAEQQVQALQNQLDELCQAQQTAEPFEQRYDEAMFVPELQSPGSVTNLLAYVEDLLGSYQQHPGLARGEVGVQRRLQHLQWLHSTLVHQQESLQRLGQRPVSPPAKGSTTPSSTPAPQ